jgi:tRNA/rRNA methyltransferase
MKKKINLDSLSIVLVRPKLHENVGSVARAMKNMGFRRLMIVQGCSPLHVNAYKLASGAEEILEGAEEFFTLREAIARMGCVVGMTSRERKERSGALLTPRSLSRRLVSISEKNLVALVFGPEREGLTNDELSHCHFVVKIPSSKSFPSLNLAQAVMVLCYELFQPSGGARVGSSLLAPVEQLEEMYDHMEEALIGIGFLDPKDPKRIMRAIRGILGRNQLDEREVRILHGIWSQMKGALKKFGEVKGQG